ncbi:MAG: lysophospholipid acyltransferase family protein [Planctomycetes bacterium]|nr:lysophospholipid acyltransferase family protein [Planctomycetota bacterium]
MHKPPTTAFQAGLPRLPTLLHRLAGWAGLLYLHLVGATSYIRKLDDPDYLTCSRGKESLIYALWHNTQVFLAYAHRGEQASVMVSQSRDGEYIAQVMQRMQLRAVRGSTSRGGGAALREMIRRVQEGRQVGFTPDGPKGPLQTIHGGVVEAARATGRPIVPTSIASRRKIVFKKSWDQFFVPLPCSQIVVAHGKPLFIAPDMPLEDAKTLVRDELNRIRDLGLKALEEAPSYLSTLLVNVLAPATGLAAAFLALWSRRPPRG